MQKVSSVVLILLFISLFKINAQINDSVVIASIYKEALNNPWAYQSLEKLCKKAPGRLAGSQASLTAIQLLKERITPFADTVYLQPISTTHWERGKPEEAAIITGNNKKTITAMALGGSVCTEKNGIQSSIVEIKSFKELKELGTDKIKGKIVFYNYPMNPMYMKTFLGYRDAGFQRVNGAAEAARYGAVGVVIRSLSNIPDEFPHTGIMRYVDSIPKIPAIAISTLDAELLSKQLINQHDVKLYFKTNCQNYPEAPSFNLIAEIKGSVQPNEIITVGGHIDSWDVCEGAHDDGAGCIHSMEVLRLFKTLQIRPKRTLRMVLFMDEEMNQTGAKAYAKFTEQRPEKIYAALESDAGGLLPVGFGCTTDSI